MAAISWQPYAVREPLARGHPPAIVLVGADRTDACQGDEAALATAAPHVHRQHFRGDIPVAVLEQAPLPTGSHLWDALGARKLVNPLDIKPSIPGRVC